MQSSIEDVTHSPPRLQTLVPEPWPNVGDNDSVHDSNRRGLKRTPSNMSDAELASMPYIGKRRRLRLKQRPPLSYMVPSSAAQKIPPHFDAPQSSLIPLL